MHGRVWESADGSQQTHHWRLRRRSHPPLSLRATGLPLVSTMAGDDADEEFWSEQRAYCDTLMDAQESVGSLLEYTQGKATDDPL